MCIHLPSTDELNVYITFWQDKKNPGKYLAVECLFQLSEMLIQILIITYDKRRPKHIMNKTNENSVASMHKAAMKFTLNHPWKFIDFLKPTPKPTKISENLTFSRL